MVSIRILTLTAALTLVLSACGDGQGETVPSNTTTTSAEANDSDRAFLAMMAPHHAGGVALGELAQELGTKPETRRLGKAVVTAQAAELEQMQAAYQSLFGEPLVLEDEPEPTIVGLRESDEFDRDFYDALIPHHQQAIEMARTELADGENAELKSLASEIVDSQSEEVEDMNAWREKYYGEPSPRGGVPPES